MIYISHRGNLTGKNHNLENPPDYVDQAHHSGCDVEVDIWCIGCELFLGHDQPNYSIDMEWLHKRSDWLWIHCKNSRAVETVSQQHNLHYFWHQLDDLTLTSRGYMWVYPGKQPVKASIAVLPELNREDIRHCVGVCSDVINQYKLA